MSSKSLEKNKDVLKELEKTISPVLVVNNSSLKPYVELFNYSPENVYQQPLGSLVGFFEIKEYSDDSAYIVNFLTSVLKKEYYINPKRGVSESLDSALHKVNLALSELVKHGNIEWLGKLNAAICVLEKNSAHFSVTGTAKIFLYRNTILSEVSEDLASDSPEPHPLKTFVNVSSGRLEENDRLIITPEDIFHILSVAEIRKNLQRLEGEKFVQFLKTALSNQLEMISTIVVEMKEEEEATAPLKIINGKTKISQAANAFSGKTFEDARFPVPETGQNEKETEEFEENPEYTDKKTGHIYVQGEANDSEETGQAHLYWDITKEKIAQMWYAYRSNMRQRISIYKMKLEKKREIARTEKERLKQIAEEEKKKQQEIKAAEAKEREKQKEIQKKEHEQFLAQQKELEKQEKEKRELERQEQERLDKEKREKEKLELENQKIEEQKALAAQLEAERLEKEKENQKTSVQDLPQEEPELSFKEKLARAIAEEGKSSVASIVDLRAQKKSAEEIFSEIEEEKIGDFEDEIVREKRQEVSRPFSEYASKASEALKKYLASAFQLISNGTQKITEKIKFKKGITEIEKEIATEHQESIFVPHFSKIKNLFASFSMKQKLSAIFVVFLIIIVPVFINKWINSTAQPSITEVQNAVIEQPKSSAVLASEKNINLAPEKKMVLSENDLVSTLVTNSNLVAITKTDVVSISDDGQQTKFPLPAESGTALRATFMKDLSLVFILTDKNKIVSFSPVSNKFADNSISLPENSSALLIGTYMTYMYVLDPKSNQIHRYPRAAGGFGEKTSWLKDTASLSDALDVTLDDNIYVAQNSKVLKFFKGKLQDFNLEKSATPAKFDRICTNIDSESLYALDKENGRIIKYSKADGSITKQYYDEELKNGISISIDESKNNAYVATPNQLIAISL